MKSLTLLSVPRSGSTWLGKIFDSAPEVAYRFQPNMAYSFTPTLDAESGAAEIENFKEQLYRTEDAFVNGQLSISGKEVTSFPKTTASLLVWKEVHSLYLADQLLAAEGNRVIGLVRSPLAVISSWLGVPKEFDPGWSVAEEWRGGGRKNQESPDNYFGYERWKTTCFHFLRLSVRYPATFRLCSYERLIEDTAGYVADLFTFAGLPVTGQTRNFLDRRTSGNSADPYSTDRIIRRDDKWREQLPASVREAILADPDFQFLTRIFDWAQ